jgi:hypothetical protein
MAPDSSAGTSVPSTVLLVEDEQGLLSLAKRILERAGYRVIAHTDPEAALDWWKDAHHRESIDLLLTDIVMPGMSGDEMLRHMRASKPGLAAVLMSGNADERSVDASYAFLGKPYTPGDLLAAVKAILPVTRPGAA